MRRFPLRSCVEVRRRENEHLAGTVVGKTIRCSLDETKTRYDVLLEDGIVLRYCRPEVLSVRTPAQVWIEDGHRRLIEWRAQRRG